MYLMSPIDSTNIKIRRVTKAYILHMNDKKTHKKFFESALSSLF